jgi:dCTP diphosphatase
MSHDDTTTLRTLRDEMAAFVEERNWQGFHRPKNLAMSIAIEAAELMEHFQWRDHDQVDAALKNPLVHEEVRDELADILSYVLSLANAADIDLASAFHAKMAKTRKKYPDGTFDV